MVRNTLKMDNLDVRPLSVKRRSAFDMQFHLTVFSIFLKTWVKDHGDHFSRLIERRI